MTWILHQGLGACPNNIPLRAQWSPCTNSQDNFPTSKGVPSTEEARSAQQDMLFSCCVVESGYSTHLPHPERRRPKTRLPSPKSEQPQRKRAAQIVIPNHSLISASAEVCAGTPHCTSSIPRGAMCTGNPALQEAGHIVLPPHYMQPFHGAVQKGWAPLFYTKL